MNKSLKILFMGTPEFSVPMLEAIHLSQHKLVGVVTAPDKPAGRGRKLTKSAVKLYAEKNNIPVLQPTNLKSPEFYGELKVLAPNVIVVVAFRMLPEKVWSFPTYGTFNLHASLLPQYRGAAPINWAIINGETQTGLTTFFIDEKIDTGKIIDNVKIPISKTDTLKEVYEKMLPKGTELVINTLDNISSETIKTVAQNKNDSIYKPAPKLNKENTRIDWRKEGVEIYNLVRGLSPYPLAWTLLVDNGQELNCKISKVKVINDNHNYTPGKILLKDKCLFVAVADGFVEILELKLAGKRLMNTKTLLNGFEISSQARAV